jgi:hypothetical protein
MWQKKMWKKMRKKRWRAALFAPLALAAGILLAETQTGDYSLTNLGEIMQPALLTQRYDAVYGVNAYPLYRPTLAPGEGREETDAYCSTCHSTRYITMQPPLPAATWEAEVIKMVKTFGQPIPEDVQPKIIKYLQTHYTPETRKK